VSVSAVGAYREPLDLHAFPTRRSSDLLFEEVLASDGHTNLGGSAKAAELAGRFGERGFDYAGNTLVDLKVWARAASAIVVNAPRSEEHTSELQSRENLVCRLLLEKKKK